METTVKYPEVVVQLTGLDGNAFAIMGRVRDGLKRAGISRSEIQRYTQESTSSGSYDELLAVALKWVECR